MILNSDDILAPETDETVYIKQLPIGNINKSLDESLNEYLKKRKNTIWVYLAKIETLNKQLEVFEGPHYCLIIKPDKKFNYNKDTQALFDIIKPFLINDSVEDFLDISIVGWNNTLQFDFKKEDCAQIYCAY